MSEGRKKKVVVIGEDDEPIATLLRDSINDEDGYQAVVVSDGALVIETVRQVHADLLIRDLTALRCSIGFERIPTSATCRCFSSARRRISTTAISRSGASRT
jgi:CheY-like chemotaxis protein